MRNTFLLFISLQVYDTLFPLPEWAKVLGLSRAEINLQLESQILIFIISPTLSNFLQLYASRIIMSS